MLVLIGLNTAFRAEDLLQLRVKDLVYGSVNIRENKTGKNQVFNLSMQILTDIREYVKRHGLTDHEYMFQSQRCDGTIKAISRQQGDRIMNDIERHLNIHYCFGLHSLRKTFGYQQYSKTRDVLTIMKMYNHDSPDITLMYIMWDDEDVKNARANNYIGIEGKVKKRRKRE